MLPASKILENLLSDCVWMCSFTEIPGYGTTSAVLMCDRLDIKSSKDSDKLKLAKDEVYLKGYYEGVMLVGECAGMKVTNSS